MVDRLDPYRARPVATNRAAVEPGGLGWLLCFALPLLVGAATAPCVHTGHPIAYALANSKVDERNVAIDQVESERACWPAATATIIADKRKPRPSSSIDLPNTMSNPSDQRPVLRSHADYGHGRPVGTSF